MASDVTRDAVDVGGAVDEIQWSDYAPHYDVMCEMNPAYKENVSTLLGYLEQWNLPSNAAICDLGAGTGNYICAMAKVLPSARFTHVDYDDGMNHEARLKYEQQGVADVEIVSSYVQNLDLAPKSYDLVVCVNALYAISPQRQALDKVRSLLKDGGKFFVIDFGRPNRPLDWLWYVARSGIKNEGIVKTTKTVIDHMDVVRQNSNARRGQEAGKYWLHDTQQFTKLLESAGFNLLHVSTCYREYCDLAVCDLGVQDVP